MADSDRPHAERRGLTGTGSIGTRLWSGPSITTNGVEMNPRRCVVERPGPRGGSQDLHACRAGSDPVGELDALVTHLESQRTLGVCENVIVPAIEKAITEHGKIRLAYVLGHHFDDYEGQAVWEDLILGVRHSTDFERIGIVTDARWATPPSGSSVSSGADKPAFPLADLDTPKRWAAETATSSLQIAAPAPGHTAPLPFIRPSQESEACETFRPSRLIPRPGNQTPKVENDHELLGIPVAGLHQLHLHRVPDAALLDLLRPLP